MRAVFIYAISTLYALQSGWYVWQGQYAPAFLTLCYALAGIPLIYMTK
jgi:hypothetical protein